MSRSVPRSNLYVWSGTLRGVCVSAQTPWEAVVKAVKASVPCVLTSCIRVSCLPRGEHPTDSFFEPPYEDHFPELFDGSLEVSIGSVEDNHADV